ncbi:MAG: hypothetical protein Q9202_004539 [Teloschistes flavicans]
MPSLGSGYNAGKLQTASYDSEDDAARTLGCLCSAGSVQSSFSSSSPARPRKAVAFEGVPVILYLASDLYYLPAGTCVRQLCLMHLAVILCIIGTLIYASIIYHRHRRRIPYHRSAQKTLDAERNRYDGPFSDPALATAPYPITTTPYPPLTANAPYAANRNSSAAPEVGGTRAKFLAEEGRWDDEHEAEIGEMDADPGGAYNGEGDGFLAKKREGKREGRWVAELSATRSVKAGSSSRVEMDAGIT